ncbi:hypothetical protein BOTCAL_0022g00100 [Botryotinia calthae]|uniref:Major facilitator superfamily (MFS) profile domain-containing protein n=1 Tax=Botryotinia calthae TaxID=38488 RepID=A0A4Y8DH44_9HELO|nr:hypothetical protein BOTCAL_0022g00100 [Botryotinia calthae]
MTLQDHNIEKLDDPEASVGSNRHSSEAITPIIPPEGGLTGWLCVIGCSMCMFSTFGFLNAIGVFQTYYQLHELSQYTPSTISWIFALQLCLMWLPAPLFGRLLDTYGPTPVLIPCSALCVFSLCMTSLCHKYYQIILAQGVGFGFGACGIFVAAFVCAGQWFEKRRGLALGIVTAGSSLGGVIFPIFVNKLIDQVGFYGTVRYVALLIGILQVFACFLVKARMPQKNWNKETKWVDFTLFKDPTFALYTAGTFLVMWGLWAPFDYLSSMALNHGFSNSLSIYLISMINAGSIPGRILPGHLADTIGYFNTMTIVCILTGLSIITLWIPFTYHSSHVGLIFFAIVYGFLSGAFISLMMPCCAKSGTLQTLGQRFGTFQSIIAISCLTGLPISGAILNRGGSRDGYLGLQVFSAVAMLGGGVVIGVARMGMAGWKLEKRV